MANDIVVKLYGPGNALLSSGDLATSPETLTYSPGGTIPQGIYQAEVCPFEDPTVPFAAAGHLRRRRVHLGQRRRGPPPRTCRAGATSPPTRRWTTRPTRPRRTPWSAAGSAARAARRPRALEQPVQRPVGLRPRLQGADVHHPRQQRQRPRGLGQPAGPRRHRAGAVLPHPGVPRPVHGRLEQLQVRPDPAASRRQRHRLRGHQPLRGAQPDARLQLRARLHRAQLQPPAGQPGPEPRPDPRERPGDRQRPGRRADRRHPVVPRSGQRQPDRPAGRHPRHHQPVPLPADRRRVLLPVHRRLRST